MLVGIYHGFHFKYTVAVFRAYTLNFSLLIGNALHIVINIIFSLYIIFYFIGLENVLGSPEIIV